MPDHYDERGNIPGPGGSRFNPIPRWQSEDDLAVLEHENRYGKEIEDISKDVIVTAASQGKFGSTPASEQTVDVAAMEVMDLHPNIYRQAVVYHKNNPDAGWGAAMKAAKLSAGSSPENLRRRFMKSPKDRYPDASDITGMAKEDPKDYSRDYFKKKFKEVGLNKNVQLDIFDMLEQQGHTEHTRRSVKMGISNPDYSVREYKKTRKILVAEFLDGLEFLGIDKNSIEAHHVASLRQTASLFEGLPPEQFPELIKMIYDEGVFTGNDPRNLIAIQRKAHINKRKDIVSVHRYLTDELGKYGELLVGDYGSEIRELPIEERLPYVKKFAAVVKGSHEVANTAIRQILDERAAEQDPGALANALSQIEQEEVKRAVSEYFERQRNPNYEALLDSIMGDTSAAGALRKKGFKPKKPYQFDLFK
tara:strand:+ start:43 stop:1302 length:1260 start_codon:yes stop_codon:yes gene_type:complete